MVTDLLTALRPYMWLLVAVTLGAAVLAVVFRGRLRRLMRLAKAVATDQRLPKPVRYLVVVGLGAKAMPIDFGVDEICLGLAVILLATRYRSVWNQIRKEVQ